MFKRFGAIWLLPILLLLTGMPAPAIQAKPPGLPAAQKDACLEKSPQQEIHSEPVIEGVSPGNVNASSANSARPAATMVFEFSIDSAAVISPGCVVLATI